MLAPVGVAVFLGLRSVEFLANKFNKLVTISGAYLLMALSLVALGIVPETADFFVGLNPFGLFEPGPLNEQTARILVTILFANTYGFAKDWVLFARAGVAARWQAPGTMSVPYGIAIAIGTLACWFLGGGSL